VENKVVQFTMYVWGSVFDHVPNNEAKESVMLVITGSALVQLVVCCRERLVLTPRGAHRTYQLLPSFFEAHGVDLSACLSNLRGYKRLFCRLEVDSVALLQIKSSIIISICKIVLLFHRRVLQVLLAC